MDNRYTTCLTIDNYLKSEIIISSAINNNGTLDLNEYGNILNGDIVKGNQIRACSFINANFLLYTPKQYSLITETYDLDIQTSNSQGILLEDEKINYKINAEVEDLVFDGGTATLQGSYDGTTNYEIFKVFLNGEETTNYISYSASNLIDFTDNIYLNTFDNTITIIYYPVDQTITTEQVNLWCYLPYEVFSGKLNYYDVDSFNVYANALEIESMTTNLLNVIPNINGNPKGQMWICNDNEARLIQSVTESKITVDKPFTEAFNGTMWWTPQMKIYTNGDYSIDDSPEYYSYTSRHNKVGIDKKIGKNNRITLTYFNYDEKEVVDKIPILSSNLSSQTLENTRFSVKEYLENSNKYNIYTNCKIISDINYNRSMVNEESLTITYDNKVGEL